MQILLQKQQRLELWLALPNSVQLLRGQGNVLNIQSVQLTAVLEGVRQHGTAKEPAKQQHMSTRSLQLAQGIK